MFRSAYAYSMMHSNPVKPVIGLSFFVATMLLAALLAQICLLMSSLLSLVLFYGDWVYDLSFLCYAVLHDAGGEGK